MAMSQLDSTQCIRTAFSDADGALKVLPASGAVLDVEVSAADGDSILATGSSDGTASGTLRVIKVSSGGVVSVDGSAVTQPVSAATLPLPTGAATLAKQPALGTAGTASADVITVQGVASMTALITRPIGYSGTHISTSTTTTSKSGAGLLHSITINTLGVGNTATVYDNTAGSGTVIAVINTAVSLGTLYYDVAFATGLTVVTASGTPADITVSYL